MVGIPIHHVKHFQKEQRAGCLPRFSFTLTHRTPLKGTTLIFPAGSECQNLCMRIDQGLNEACIRESVQASGIDIEFAVIEGYCRFMGMRKELSADNLELLQIEHLAHLDQFFRIIQNRKLMQLCIQIRGICFCCEPLLGCIARILPPQISMPCNSWAMKRFNSSNPVTRSLFPVSKSCPSRRSIQSASLCR